MKNKKGIIYTILLLTTLVVGLSYGAFIFSTDKYRSSELLISKLNYSIDIQEDGNNKSIINGTSVTVPASTKVYLNITLTSVNEIDSKYTLAYKTTSNAKVQYSDRTQWNTKGIIKGIDSNTYSKKIRVVIDNSEVTTASAVNFQVYGGYSFNTYANIELNDGYVTVGGPYTEVATNIGNRLVDIIESDTSCLTSSSSTCLYGGDNIKNYVQYPEDEDKTKNLWRIIGSYQIDGTTLPKLISQSTTSTSTSTLTTDLTSFYNTLEDKEVLVQQTNKFNCFTSECAESTYNNIGLLTDYEYNQIGGVNSYLASNENYYINSSNGIKEVTSSGITNSSSTSGLRGAIYLQTDVVVTGSGTVNDPYIISPASDINLVAYTLNGKATDKTYAELLKEHVVKSVTCKNGTTATWDYDKAGVLLTNVHTPDYCTINFGDGYSVSLTATNGIVSPSNVIVGYNGSASFTVTPNDGYKAELETNTCSGTLSGSTYTISNITGAKTCNISFKEENPFTSGTLTYQLYKDKTVRLTSPRGTGYNVVYTSDNTKTLYTATENGTTVYYFAGNAQDNWVKFGEYYWRIIRTNSDGGVRLLYHGASTTATDAYISTSTKYNSTHNDPMYVGYMYGTSGSLENNRKNTNSSTIKEVIDTWFVNTLKTKYNNYISTTAVYCNDRSVTDGTYSTTSAFKYAAYTRLNTNKAPTYDCAAMEDRFTVSSSTGNGKLTYPIALMTADEVAFAGGVYGSPATTWYYYNSAKGSSTGEEWWWLMSPHDKYSKLAIAFSVIGSDSPGDLGGYSYVGNSGGVRPVISLKSDVLYKSGDGSANFPYQIVGGSIADND